MIRLAGAMLLSLCFPLLLVGGVVSSIAAASRSSSKDAATVVVSAPTTPAPKPTGATPIPLDALQRAAVDDLANLVTSLTTDVNTFSKGTTVPPTHLRALRQKIQDWLGTNRLLFAGQLGAVDATARKAVLLLTAVEDVEARRPGAAKRYEAAYEALRKALKAASRLSLA